jgi:FkbM family methyltransferase
MKFISYAQNFEDVILNRAFKGRDEGLYIDAGASHPIGHSVTKNFYDRGWRGINIEPGTKMFALIEVERGRDINLNVGLARTSGIARFYESPDSLGNSTFNDELRDRYLSRGERTFEEKTVRTMTLVEVCERYVDRPIDFLKVDVEGLEAEVLAGGDFARWRPRVVLVEGDRRVYQEVLLASKYLHAAFDGVNHYFVPEEEEALIEALTAPVSLVIDDFELHEHRIDREGHQNAYKLLLEARKTRDEFEIELVMRRHEMGLLQESSSRTIADLTTRRDELEVALEERRSELVRHQAWSTQALSEATARSHGLEDELAGQRREMACLEESLTQAILEATTRGEQLAEQRDEMARFQESSRLAIAELTTSRDGLELALRISKGEFEEITARHAALRTRLAPLIKVHRGLKKVRGILSHPSHRLFRLSSAFRSAARRAGSQPGEAMLSTDRADHDTGRRSEGHP